MRYTRSTRGEFWASRGRRSLAPCLHSDHVQRRSNLPCRHRPVLINVDAREQVAEILEPTWPRRRWDTRGAFFFGRRSGSRARSVAVSHPFDWDRGGPRRSQLTVLRILNAHRGFASDGVEAFCKTRERAVGAAGGEIRAPLTALLIALGPRASAEYVPDKENSERECEGYAWQDTLMGRGAARCSGLALPFPQERKCRVLALGHKSCSQSALCRRADKSM